MIELQNITKTYTVDHQQFDAIHNINLTINTGDIIGIVGYSGAGKSTLIRLINGLIRPTSGNIIIDGVNILLLKKQAIDRMRQQIGMIFQSFNLFYQYDVYHNVKLALDIHKYSGDKNERILQLLDLVGLSHKQKAYPKQLSGGEQQRVAIARALANNPKYLLCDEATSALDLKTANEILLLLKHIQQKTNVTIIFITHQIEAVRKICNRVAIMNQGKIIEEGKTLAIFMNPKEEITKTLVKQNVAIDETIEDVYELIYQSKPNESSLLSQTIKLFNVDINIIHAKVLEILDQNVGYLYIKMTGKDQNKAIDYLVSHGLSVHKYDRL